MWSLWSYMVKAPFWLAFSSAAEVLHLALNLEEECLNVIVVIVCDLLQSHNGQNQNYLGRDLSNGDRCGLGDTFWILILANHTPALPVAHTLCRTAPVSLFTNKDNSKVPYYIIELKESIDNSLVDGLALLLTYS